MASVKNEWSDKVNGPCRVGIINVSKCFEDNAVNGAMDVLLKDALVLETRDIEDYEGTQYIVYFESFDIVKEKSLVPEYRPIMEKTKDGKINRLRFEKIPDWHIILNDLIECMESTTTGIKEA